MVQNKKIDPVQHHAEHVAQIRSVSIASIGRWLRKGIDDFKSAPLVSISYGLLFSVIGILISVAAISQPKLVMVFWAGFLFVGPILAMGLYRIAQLRENGDPISLRTCVSVLLKHKSKSALFMLLMSLVMLAWIRFSTLIVALYFGQVVPKMPTLSSLLSSDGLQLLGVLGASAGLFSLFVFALSAISLPMLLDGKAGLITSILTSFHALRQQPVVMLTWAVVIATMTLIGMLTFFIGFVVIFPLLGYATWHSYRELVS